MGKKLTACAGNGLASRDLLLESSLTFIANRHSADHPCVKRKKS